MKRTQIIVVCLGDTLSTPYSEELLDDLRHSTKLDNDPIRQVIVLGPQFQIIESFSAVGTEKVSKIRMN